MDGGIMRKRFLKALAAFLSRPIVKVFFYLGGMALVLGFSGAFSDNQSFVNAFSEILVSEDTLSLFFAGLFSLGVAKLLSWFEGYMEESMKTEDNHRKIISQYDKHTPYKTLPDKTFQDTNGGYLTLQHVQKGKAVMPEALPEGATQKEKRKYERAMGRWERAIVRKTPGKDTLSSEYRKNREYATRYLKDGQLCLASINMFANVGADTKVCFDDNPQEHKLPSFVITHADELLQAHKNSTKSNKNTIRLDDFSYADNKLTLKTSRSTYYHMLITNRCMDFRFANGMSIREVYEYEREICPLSRSKFGNQIGINGLILTKDNYILIEKRDRKKITWKNKFAQSISLALKSDDMKIKRGQRLEETSSKAEERLRKVIEKTIRSNFGLELTECQPFSMEKNFFGLARDLLEGGKPNLYFFVKTECTAEELKVKLQENVKNTEFEDEAGNEKTVIDAGKLSSDYYLVPFEEIAIDYDYRLHMNRRDAIRVRRKLSPRCSWLAQTWDIAKEWTARICKPEIKRECGEALLVTLAYMEICPQWRDS